MIEMLAFIYLGVMPVTAYIPDEKQTDSTPTRTSINHRVNPFGIAVSQDLMRSGEACYGDTIHVEGFGNRMVNDVMNSRHTRRVDLFVDTKDEEKLIQTQKRKIYVMHSTVRACTREEAMKMGMVNAKKLRKAINEFKKQNGREPSYDELRNNIVSGRPVSRTPHSDKGQAAGDGGSKGRPSH